MFDDLFEFILRNVSGSVCVEQLESGSEGDDSFLESQPEPYNAFVNAPKR